MALNLQFCITKSEFHITSKDKAKKSLNNIINAYKKGTKLLSIIKLAYVYAILKVILYCKMNIYCNQI